jgi:RHS repeat-associated protein
LRTPHARRRAYPLNGYYTAVNLLQSYVPPPVSDVPNSATTFFYNADRSLEYVRQPGGRGVDYVYNAGNGQLTGILAGGATDASFSYYSSNGSGAANGRLQTATRGATTVTLKYDGSLTTSQAWSGTAAGAVNGSAAWSYDADFRVKSETVSPAPTPTGLGTASYLYDADGLLTCASLSASLSTCTPSASTMVLTRSTTSGALTGTTLGVITESYTQNEYGEPATYSATASGAVFSLTYDDGSQTLSRDGFGRIYHQTESATGVGVTISDYRYDEQGRLSKVLLNNVLTRQYGYDYNGNRTSVDPSGAIIATYDNQDRMLTYNGVSYGYGSNGERSSRTNTDGSVDQYQYDALGNLAHITRADGVTIDYVVDAFNRRIAKKKNGATYAQYIYRNGLSPAAVLTSSGALAARFVYASRPNTPDLMVLANGTVYKFINDERGSPRLIVNATTGAVVKYMTYDEFGNETVGLDAGAFPPWMQPFGFDGGLYDEDTGLVRFGARDYEAATGRWLAKDPILFGGGQSNLYVYAGNDPVNRLDPSGLWGISFGANGSAAGPALSAAVEGGFGFFWDASAESISFYSSVGAGGALVPTGGSVGVSAQLGYVSDGASFWGSGTELGINTPAGGVALNNTTPALGTGYGTLNAITFGAGPSFGGDVHLLQTETKELSRFEYGAWWRGLWRAASIPASWGICP